jgi:hypothetical protein
MEEKKTRVEAMMRIRKLKEKSSCMKQRRGYREMDRTQQEGFTGKGGDEKRRKRREYQN